MLFLGEMVAYMDAESVVKAITEHETKIIAAEHRIKDLEEQSKNLQSLTFALKVRSEELGVRSGGRGAQILWRPNTPFYISIYALLI